MRFSPLIMVIVSLTQLCWKSSLPVLRKRLLPVPKIFSSKKNISCQFIFSKCIQKYTEYDLFVCGDTLCLMASVYSLRRLFMNYNESTHQEYVLTRSNYNLLFVFYFLLFYFLKSWTFFPFTTRRFREFLRLLPFGVDLYFSFFFIFFNSLSFFLLSCHFLFDRQAFCFCGGFTLYGNGFLSFLFLLFLDQ